MTATESVFEGADEHSGFGACNILRIVYGLAGIVQAYSLAPFTACIHLL